MSCEYSKVNEYGRLVCMVEGGNPPRLCPYQRYCGKTFSWSATPESNYCTRPAEVAKKKALELASMPKTKIEEVEVVKEEAPIIEKISKIEEKPEKVEAPVIEKETATVASKVEIEEKKSEKKEEPRNSFEKKDYKNKSSNYKKQSKK